MSRVRLMPCPACAANLQPLEPSSSYASRAFLHATGLGLELPAHGPNAIVWLSLVAHAMIVHDDLDLGEYLEAYRSD